jgi:uncharacterized cupin superfamily protein
VPKIDLAALPVLRGSFYPPQFQALVAGRSAQILGDAAGLTQFGVNLFRIPPGAASSQRHWHDREDEFLVMTEGELWLIEDAGETLLKAGDCAGFPAGVPNGHHLVNRSDADAAFIVVGTRDPQDRTTYPDIDMLCVPGEDGGVFCRKSGEPY